MDFEFELRKLNQLDGKNICLRRFTLGDAGDVFDYASDPLVTCHLTWETHQSIENTIEVMKRLFLAKPYMYAIALPDSDRCLGSIDLRINEKHNYASFGYCLNRQYWNRGYTTEALGLLLDLGFNHLGLHRMEGYCCPDNPASGRVMEKCGMVREGLQRQSAFMKGVYLDEVLYGILADDPRPGK